MDFELTPRETALAEGIRTLLAENPEPAPAEVRAWFQRLGRAGYLEAGLGPDGRGQAVGLLLARQALAARAPWLVFAAELHRMVTGLIAAHGDPALLPPLLAGDRLAAAAFSELGGGLSPGEFTCRAEPEGDGAGFLLTGEKFQVSLASTCDLLAVLAMTPGGPAVLLVERADPGVLPGAPLDSFGFAELDSRPVRFDSARVPAGRVLGPLPPAREAELGGALRRAEDDLATGVALGLIERCLAEARTAADAPRASGKPKAAHQLVRFTLAELLTLKQTAELLALRAAAAAAGARPEASRLGLTAKVFATEAACRVSDAALGIVASAGYRRSHPVARAVAEARFGTLTGHDSRAARMAIADELLERLAPG
jgi:hypothetical protein